MNSSTQVNDATALNKSKMPRVGPRKSSVSAIQRSEGGLGSEKRSVRLSSFHFLKTFSREK